jgi:hypothetical protein
MREFEESTDSTSLTEEANELGGNRSKQGPMLGQSEKSMDSALFTELPDDLCSRLWYRLTRVILIVLYVLTVVLTFALISASEKARPTMFVQMALGWVIIHIAIVTLRGAVLYVAMGRFLPSNRLKSWLVP